MNARPAAIFCAGIVLLAGGFRAVAADNGRIQDVWAPPDPGKIVERNGVRWNERFDGAGYTKACKTPNYTDWCLPGKLRVRNETGAPIVCHGEIHMPPGNQLSLPSAARDMIVMEHGNVVLVKTMTSVNIREQSYTSDCKPWKPPPPPDSKASCTYLPDAGAIKIDYPPGARVREEEGPVVLQFTLSAGSGRPEKIEVAGSSMFPELDAAAVRTLAATEMSTQCPGARFNVQLNYELGDGPPTSPAGEPCKVRVVKAVDLNDYYPKGSVERGEQGELVYLVFANETPGPPSSVELKTGTGFHELDRAAYKAIKDFQFSSNCPDQPQLFKLKFVNERAQPAPSR